ncbi:MAG: DUF4276 family protein [Hymenobacter sp.]|nr:MAG: DUF4276 family protein [Hymenobacter sp.]
MAAKPKVVRVGLLGESPNDTEAIKVLLQRQHTSRITCFPLLERLTGGTLDSAKVLRALPVACARQRPDVVIVIRDLDALASNQVQLRLRQTYFDRVNREVGGRALYLLHIYEFEALLAADIQSFNALYKSACKIPGDPTQLVDPKKVLQHATRKSPRGAYHENHSAAVCAYLNYEQVVKNCRYFREFDAAFAQRLA